MNTKQLFAASLIALAGTTAWADDIGLDGAAFVSTRSRADVRAELQVARAQGQLQQAGERSIDVAAPLSIQARDLVRTEVRAANARHELMAAGEAMAIAMHSSPARRAQ